jgi:hypothetical protein
MGSLIQINHRRSAVPSAPPAAAASAGAPRLGCTPPARNHDDDSRRSLLVLVIVFTATAIAMSASVVIAGSNSWAEAIPLIVFVVVFALTKVFLANAVFYVMLRSDVRSEAVAAEAALKAKAAGLVIRRPRMPPGLKRSSLAGARPRRGGGPSSTVRLAVPLRKPGDSSPRRSDH